ncbi:MAG: GAF domain-containing protein [Chloroflexota bacterium]
MTDEATLIRLLYMSANNNTAITVQDHLQMHGYAVDIVGNGITHDALKLQSYQLALVDHLPDKHQEHEAVETFDRLRSVADLPTIVLCNPNQDDDTRKQIAAQVPDCIVKDTAGQYLKLLPILIEQVIRRQTLSQENESTLRALQQKNRDLTLLTRVGQELTATHDAEVIVKRLLQAVTETIGAEGASVWLWDEEKKGPLVCQSVFHQSFDQKLLNLSVPPGEGVVGWVARTGNSAIVHSPQDDKRFTANIDAQSGFKTTSILAIPLVLREEVMGVLELVNKLTGEFNDEDCALLETLASSAAIAIDNARLVKALRENTIELEHKNEDLDAFAHTVAHDLKNPLGLILGTAQVLESDYDNLEPETVRHQLEVITRNSRKATGLVEELLLLAQIRDTDVFVEPLPMNMIVDEVLKRLSESYNVDEAKITLPEQWPLSLGYAPWVENVWLNLMSNGLKYGGTPPHLEIGAKSIQGTQIQFWLTDNGNGLNATQKAQIFKPFKRFDRKKATGHGLGLSIVQRIVEKLGGQISVTSTGVPGQGCTFQFTLPAVEPR